MTGFAFDLCGAQLAALPSGALWWGARRLLCVADLHFGKAQRAARQGGAALPPYDTRETLVRLARDIDATAPSCVICLGDSFDDPQAATRLAAPDRAQLLALMAGRRWIWIAGNHDPAPPPDALPADTLLPDRIPGDHLPGFCDGPVRFRHIATDLPASGAEITGHFHPKARLRLGGAALSAPCFLIDARRVILPAYGAYTGGLDCRDPALARLMGPGALAVLTGSRARAIPMPR